MCSGLASIIFKQIFYGPKKSRDNSVIPWHLILLPMIDSGLRLLVSLSMFKIKVDLSISSVNQFAHHSRN